MAGERTTALIWRGAIALAGGWAAFNGLWYAMDFDRRYRAESAWLIFAATLAGFALTALVRGRDTAAPETSSATRLASAPGLAALVAVSIVTYHRMLVIGLLSDDFVLLARAQSGALADTGWEFLRPLPLGVWQIFSAFDRALDVPTAMHALNVVLHGLNAWLVLKLGTRLGVAAPSALLGALLFVAFPAGIEAVAWASGVFDVLLTTLTLSACMVITGAGGGSRSLIVALITTAAVLTKETAVVLPALLVAAAWCASPSTLRRALVPVAASAAVVVLYFAARIAAGFESAPPAGGLSGYAIKEMVSRPFGTIGLPFHVDVLHAHAWIPYALAVYWPALFIHGAWRWTRDATGARHALGLSAFILLSIAPLAGMLFIAPDLQGSRYVYLGSAAFCLIPLVLLRRLESRRQVLAVGPLVLLFGVANFANQSPWVAAASERDRILAAYRDSGLNCVPQSARGLPDHINGAYLFRNGFAEAVAGTGASTGSAGPCHVAWDGTTFRFSLPAEPTHPNRP